MENVAIFKLFLICLLLHLFADFTLQGCLASMKQKEWWEKLFKNEEEHQKYRNDYKCALYCHSIYWTLVTFAPILFFSEISTETISIIFFTNMIVHYMIDDLKANLYRINLCTDQMMHVVQIAITVILFKIL